MGGFSNQLFPHLPCLQDPTNPRNCLRTSLLSQTEDTDVHPTYRSVVFKPWLLQFNLQHSSLKNTLFPSHWWGWISPPEHMLLCFRGRWYRTCPPGNCVTYSLHHDSDYCKKNQFQHLMSLQVGQLMYLLTLPHPTPTFLRFLFESRWLSAFSWKLCQNLYHTWLESSVSLLMPSLHHLFLYPCSLCLNNSIQEVPGEMRAPSGILSLPFVILISREQSLTDTMTITQNQIAHTNYLELFRFQIILKISDYCSEIHVGIKQPLTPLYCSGQWHLEVLYLQTTIPCNSAFCATESPTNPHNSAGKARRAGKDVSKNSSECCFVSILSTPLFPCSVLREGWKPSSTRHHTCFLKMQHITVPLEPMGLCRAQTHCPPQTAHRCACWCYHIPEGRTGPWRHLSLPLLHQPSRGLQGTIADTEVEFVTDLLQFPTQRFSKSILSRGSPLWQQKVVPD